jgi:hypothetical protein
LKGKISKPPSFMVPLHVEPPEVGDGDPLTCKDFVDIYGLCVEGMSLKWIRVFRDITIEKVCKLFGPIQNKIGHSYVFSENLVLIAKVERLWMLVH